MLNCSKNRLLVTCALGAAFVFTSAVAAEARDQIRAVGSSTVYPFTSAAAEQFGAEGKFKTPLVESTGTGGGFKLFCAGVGETHPDINNASRPITDSEKTLCKQNGVEKIVEVSIGYDGIVIANAKGAPTLDLTKKQLFMALARELPGKDGKLAANPNQKWSDIDAKLPAQTIEVYGPPPTSGTRDAFVELVMEEACKEFPEFATAIPDEKARKKACGVIREDGRYIDAGEDDNLIIQKLASNSNAVGIFGYSFLEENKAKVQGNKINGVAPTMENIENQSYKISRSLFVYVKGDHLGKIPGISEFINGMVSDAAIGPNGYLISKGLLPLHANDLAKARAAAESLKTAK
jgi:phosphate transport system substrate-binding protein